MQNNLRYWTSQQQEKGVWVYEYLNKCYDSKVQLDAWIYLPLKLVRISNMMRFPQSQSKNDIIIGILTLGFLEVAEVEYDEGSEWPITLGRLDVFV